MSVFTFAKTNFKEIAVTVQTQKSVPRRPSQQKVQDYTFNKVSMGLGQY